ncbi:hypothetical protein JTB14_029975 [Gonioctena quinquepunctata]|nr:hypothetical protein JTB14_029975 [Gonioctena quinquepunctata]
MKSPRKEDGMKKYTENQIEYKYMNNLSELLKWLYSNASEEQAVNNNFHNEKLGVVHLITKEMENIIDTPKGIEYLISHVCSLPEGVFQAAGLLNDFINNSPFELHWPDENYPGSSTKLDKGLARGDKPVDELDEAAMEHDIFNRDHKNVQDIHKADEILENKALERFFDPNAEFSEQIPTWVTYKRSESQKTFWNRKSLPFQLKNKQIGKEKLKFHLTDLQINKLEKAKKNGTGVRVDIKYEQITSDGFLLSLLAGVGALGSLIGAESTIANTVINKRAKDKELEEQQRQNEVLEEKGLKTKIKKIPPSTD